MHWCFKRIQTANFLGEKKTFYRLRHCQKCPYYFALLTIRFFYLGFKRRTFYVRSRNSTVTTDPFSVFIPPSWTHRHFLNLLGNRLRVKSTLILIRFTSLSFLPLAPKKVLFEKKISQVAPILSKK